MNTIKGFTLIEVLIAMLVLAVGLLGLASLQAYSLRNTQSAYNRSLATELAYDLADRMRANNKPLGLAVYGSMQPTAALAQANCVTVSNFCPPDVMAENDLYQWNLAVTTALPSSSGVIAVAASVYTITVSWNDGATVLSFVTSFRL
jgi:type IV pilus assembly protein PilV